MKLKPLFIFAAFVMIASYAVYYAIEKDCILLQWGSMEADRVFSWGLFLGIILVFVGKGQEERNRLVKWGVYYWTAIFFFILLWVYMVNAICNSCIIINKPICSAIAASFVSLIGFLLATTFKSRKT